MKNRMNIIAIVILFLLIFSIEIPYINRIFFTSEQYPIYKGWIFLGVNLLCILGIAFLIRGIIFDLVFYSFSGVFDKHFEVVQLNKYYKPVLFICTIFLYAVALSGETNYFYFSIIILCFQISINSQKVLFCNNKAYYIDDYSLRLFKIDSYKLYRSNTIILYFESKNSKAISFPRKNLINLDSIKESLAVCMEET